MKKNKIISPYFENRVFAGVRVTLGDEDFVIAPMDYKDGKRMFWREAMDALKTDNLDTWNYRQICFTMAFCKEINKVLKDNGGDKLDGAYWTGVEYSRTCSFSFYCDNVLSFDYKYLALRIRPIKNLKNKYFCIMSNSKMELPKTIDEFLDKYPYGYSNSWRKIIRERGMQIKKNFRITIKGKSKI